MVWLHAAALPPPLKVKLPLPAESPVGNSTAAMGLSAALTALKAFSIPAPHWLVVQAHSFVLLKLGQTGVPGGAVNGDALDLMRAINCPGVRLLLTARIRAATP